MAFPVNGVLDNFDRADADNLGAAWTEPLFAAHGSSDWRISGNEALANGGSGIPNSAYWNTGTFGPDCEVYFTVAGNIQNNRNMEIMLRVDLNGGTPNGYVLRVRPGAGGDIITVQRLDAGAYTQLGDDIAQEVNLGDAVGLEAVGDTLTVYYKAAAGSWAALDTRSDSTYGSAGYIAINYNHTTPTYDDFGGGTLAGGGGGDGLTPGMLRPMGIIF